jgi:uncharacterized protein
MLRVVDKLLGRKMRRGSCLQCGRCCRSLILVDRGRPIRDEEHLARYAKRHPWARNLVPVGRDEEGMLHLSCSKLGEDNRCTIHRLRPKECREYPQESMSRYGGELLLGCGYGEPTFEQVLRDEVEQLDDDDSSNSS